MKKSTGIFGSTGSLGKQTVELIQQQLDCYSVEVLTANNNWELLAHQAKILKAKKVVIVNSKYYRELKQELLSSKTEVLSGYNALIECAGIPLDINFMVIVGIAGLAPTMEAIKSAKILATANKESLVCGGHIINRIPHQAKIIPLDSEHNAIFQIYNKQVEKITLTASGGPFHKGQEINNITVEQALKHPVWRNMGRKISVDSATMMNKVLEVIEAHYLFECETSEIDILIHPEAIIHGMVSYTDGNSIAVLSRPDMKIPLACALNWPNRKNTVKCGLNLAEICKLSFYKPDYNKFPALHFSQTKNYVALNAANEVAVKFFLEGKIIFSDIVRMIDNIISHCPEWNLDSLEEILEYDKYIKSLARKLSDIILH